MTYVCTKRTSLWLVTASAVAVIVSLSCLLAVYRGNNLKREALIARIRNDGGFVHFDYQWTWNTREKFQNAQEPTPGHFAIKFLLGSTYATRVTLIQVEPHTDIKLRELSTFRDLEYLYFYDRHVDPREWQGLTAHRSLKVLALFSTDFDDEAVKYIPEIAGLEFLSLADTQVTDHALEHLKRLPELRELSVAGTHISDAGLGSFVDYPRLEILQLNDTRATDDGLQVLAECRSLRQLEIVGTAVTERGVSQFQRRRPDVTVVWR